MNRKKEIIKLDLAFLIRYMGDALLYPFMFLYFQSLGYKNDQISYILIIFPLVSIFINPFWTYFAKNINRNIFLIVMLTALETGAILAFIFFTKNIYIVALISLAIAIFSQPIYLLLDSFAGGFCENNDYEFANIRIFGAIGYALLCVVGGLVADYFGFKVSFLSAVTLFVLAGVLIFLIKPIKFNKSAKFAEKTQLKLLFKNKKFWIFTTIFVLFMSTFKVFDQFQPDYFLVVGAINKSWYGAILTGFVVIETIFIFLLARYFKEVDSYLLFGVAIALTLFRFFVYISTDNIYAIIAVTLLRSISMAIFIFVYFKLLFSLVAPNNFNFSVIIINSLVNVLFIGLNIFAGKLTKNHEYFYFFLICIVLCGVAFLIYARDIMKKIEKEYFDINVNAWSSL